MPPRPPAGAGKPEPAAAGRRLTPYPRRAARAPGTEAACFRVWRQGDSACANNYDKGRPAGGVQRHGGHRHRPCRFEDHTLTVPDRRGRGTVGLRTSTNSTSWRHAYAVTIPTVPRAASTPAVRHSPLTTSSWMMLQRNLLYTGVTPRQEASSSLGPALPARAPRRRDPHQGLGPAAHTAPSPPHKHEPHKHDESTDQGRTRSQAECQGLGGTGAAVLSGPARQGWRARCSTPSSP